MLSVSEAQQIADQWRDRFADPAAFEQSWARFFEMVGDPNPLRLQDWLSKDQQKDAVRHAGIVSEPLRPTRQKFEVRDVNSCAICRGKRYVHQDLSIDHPDFGKAFRCPRCNA